MAKIAFATALSGALALGSFLSLGMGMDMGTAWAPQTSHGCCPSGPAEQASDAGCCLILPAALPSPVALPGPVPLFFTLEPSPAAVAVSASSRPLLLFGPPGDPSPGHSVLSASRAPPAA